MFKVRRVWTVGCITALSLVYGACGSGETARTKSESQRIARSETVAVSSPKDKTKKADQWSAKGRYTDSEGTSSFQDLTMEKTSGFFHPCPGRMLRLYAARGVAREHLGRCAV